MGDAETDIESFTWVNTEGEKKYFYYHSDTPEQGVQIPANNVWLQRRTNNAMEIPVYFEYVDAVNEAVRTWRMSTVDDNDDEKYFEQHPIVRTLMTLNNAISVPQGSTVWGVIHGLIEVGNGEFDGNNNNQNVKKGVITVFGLCWFV